MTTSEAKNDDCDNWKIAAYVLVGFCILLDLRFGLNGSPFTIKRFHIPEHLFSLYVSRLNGGMEFSSAVGSAMGTALVLSIKGEDEGKKNEKAYLAIVVNWLFWLSDMIFIVVYTTGGEYGYPTLFYWTLCFSSWTYGANQAFIFPMAGKCTVYYLSTVHASSIFTSVLNWIMLKFVGNRRKYDTDMIVMVVQIVASIFFTLASAIVFTVQYYGGDKDEGTPPDGEWYVSLSAMLMCITGLGVVYAFYPAIAPGMLVDFRYINRIDQAILVLTPFPSIIIAVISKPEKTKKYSPSNKWESNLHWWHTTHIFGVIMITCGILFIISLHYPQSPVARSIVNKPWTVGFLTIIYYASHLALIGVGFAGVGKNCSQNDKDYVTTINNFFVRSSMIVFIYISEGYIQEFKIIPYQVQ